MANIVVISGRSRPRAKGEGVGAFLALPAFPAAAIFFPKMRGGGGGGSPSQFLRSATDDNQ